MLAGLFAWCLLRLSRPRTFSPDGARFMFAPEMFPGDGEPSGAKVLAPGPDAVAPVALWVTACLSLAFSLAAPYSLPWYDLLVWAALPALLPGLVDLSLIHI